MGLDRYVAVCVAVSPSPQHTYKLQIHTHPTLMHAGKMFPSDCAACFYSNTQFNYALPDSFHVPCLQALCAASEEKEFLLSVLHAEQAMHEKLRAACDEKEAELKVCVRVRACMTACVCVKGGGALQLTRVWLEDCIWLILGLGSFDLMV